MEIVEFLKDLYYNYWANQQGDLVKVPAMKAAKLTLAILSYTQHLAAMAKAAQKILIRMLVFFQYQTNLKARVD